MILKISHLTLSSSLRQDGRVRHQLLLLHHQVHRRCRVNLNVGAVLILWSMLSRPLCRLPRTKCRDHTTHILSVSYWHRVPFFLVSTPLWRLVGFGARKPLYGFQRPYVALDGFQYLMLFGGLWRPYIVFVIWWVSALLRCSLGFVTLKSFNWFRHHYTTQLVSALWCHSMGFSALKPIYGFQRTQADLWVSVH